MNVRLMKMGERPWCREFVFLNDKLKLNESTLQSDDTCFHKRR